ncbi:MAG: site-2 protease family protein [Boseongicola sp. SB0677_bin_26]|nr:site-2 protease family protein [Boseongicola sp. SB0665_bin_10]MYG25011.1 site-2 protease family protein [Boseongicola sp. SB0677_bin_26]
MCQSVIIVHSFGHYVVGRWSGIRAEAFSIGVGPVLASRIDRHGTRWQLALVPFGTRLEFGCDQERIAPLPARAITALAGPVFNFAFSLALFAALQLIRDMAMDPDDIRGLIAPSFESGLDDLRLAIRALLADVQHIVTDETSLCNFPGPISIGTTYVLAASQSWVALVIIIASVSTMFGVINLFPVPGLDGGDLVFHAWEFVTGRPPSDELKGLTSAIGLTMISWFLLFLVGLDIFCP